MKMIEQIFEKYDLRVKNTKPVHGGDINEAFEVTTGVGRFFLKLNDAATYPEMFEREAEGLHALRNTNGIKVPEVVGYGEIGKKQYLLLEWLDKAGPGKNSWALLGAGMAAVHKNSARYPGWHVNNYIGSLVQSNDTRPDWPLFYHEQRVMPLLKRLFGMGAISNEDMRTGEEFCSRLDKFFPGEPSSLLHGDFWGGNFMMTTGGVPAIFDPAVYYGHREMDIGMTLLFGGFDRTFYDAYQEEFSLERGWQQRTSVTQLYPILVHAVLFGGHYIRQSVSIMKAWL